MQVTIPDASKPDSLRLSPTDFDAILFDLDGTLIDTAPDLLFALNRVMEEENKPPLSREELLPFVSGGSPAMLQRGFRIAPEEPAFAGLKERFLAIYSANIARSSHLFPGMETVLARIEAAPMVWGIVTNKSGWLTEPLTAALGLDRRAACIVSGDTTAHLKPHPAALLLACERIGAEPGRCLYVGDAAKDIEAGRRAGMRTAAALFGYLTPGDKPEEWGADWLLSSPWALANWLS